MSVSAKKKINWGLIAVVVIIVAVVIWAIVTQARENYMHDAMLSELKEKLVQISPEVAKAANGVAWYSANRSYTINKEKVHMCLRDEKGEYYNKNMLLYVAIHELAHVMQDSIGHTPQFHEKFDQLLKQAAKAGIYDPNEPIITDYCTHGEGS